MRWMLVWPLVALSALSVSTVAAQTAVAKPPALELPPIPMAPDRSEESYTIYSQLMPGSKFENSSRPRGLWLIRDTTVATVKPDEPCQPADKMSMNPHNAIAPPEERRAEFSEVLDDFDRRCHERIQLTDERWRLPVPHRLLSAAEEQEVFSLRFRTLANGLPDPALIEKYKGSPGENMFSQVYFNSHHTLAIVYAKQWCGGLCASMYWVVLEKKDGQWRSLDWVRMAGGS